MKHCHIEFEINYLRPYIPPRCRKARYEEKKEKVKIGIRMISSDEAPVAFRLSDYHHVSEHTTEIRFFKGKLYMQMRLYNTRGCNKEERLNPVTPEDLYLPPYWREQDDRQTCVENCRKFAREHLVIDGNVWKQCGEPRYEIITFGLGHNHGGTGLFVEHFYNSNIRNDNYFSALDGKSAVEYANSVAAGRGDTNDVGKFEEMIEVLMPECVKVKPKKQHGNGNDFINKINDITSSADSALEAGLMAMLCTFSQTASK